MATSVEMREKTHTTIVEAGKEVQRITHDIVAKREELIVAKKDENAACSRRSRIETEILNLEDQLLGLIKIIAPRAMEGL